MIRDCTAVDSTVQSVEPVGVYLLIKISVLWWASLKSTYLSCLLVFSCICKVNDGKHVCAYAYLFHSAIGTNEIPASIDLTRSRHYRTEKNHDFSTFLKMFVFLRLFTCGKALNKSDFAKHFAISTQRSNFATFRFK